MHIFEIKYSRGRTVQPRAYESDRIDVELTAQLIEGEDVAKAIELLRALTLKEVGRNKPGKTTETVTAKEKETPAATETASEAAGEEPAAETATAAAEKPAKKTRKKKAAAKPAEETARAEGVTGEIQDEELVAEAAKAAGSITPQGVKDIMAEFGVPRLSVIAQEQRLEFIAKLHEAVKTRKDADAKETPENEIPL